MMIFDILYTTLDISVFDHCYARKSVHGGLHRQELVQYFVLFQVRLPTFVLTLNVLQSCRKLQHKPT